MVLETVRQIKLTEETCTQSIKNSKRQARMIIENAHEAAKKLFFEAENEAKDEKKKLVKNALQKAENEVVSMRKGSEIKRNELKKHANSKISAAKSYLLENLIEKSEK